MKKILSTLLISISATTFADTAANSANCDPSSPYIGMAAGAAWNNVVSPATAFRIDGGYNWNQYIAFEVGTTGITQSGSSPNQSMQYYDASLKGTLPIGDILALFIQVGGAYGSPGVVGSNADINIYPGAHQAGWNFLTAAGAQINITKQVSINVTDYYYWGAPNPQGNSNVLLGGVKYNFN